MGSKSTKDIPIPQPDASLYSSGTKSDSKKSFFVINNDKGYSLNAFAVKSINHKVAGLNTKSDSWSWTRSNGQPYRVIIWSHSLTTDNSRMFNYLQSVANGLMDTTIIICYDYPGFANSKPKQFSLTNSIGALDCVVDFIKNRTDEKNIFLIGHEFGAEVVVEYAYDVNWTQPLMLIASRLSLMSETYKPNPKSLDYTSNDKLQQLTAPVLIVQHRSYSEPLNLCDAQQTLTALKNPLQPIWIESEKTIDSNNILTTITDRDYMDFVSMSRPSAGYRNIDDRRTAALTYEQECNNIAKRISRDDFDI
jgi:hypothetical protein